MRQTKNYLLLVLGVVCLALFLHFSQLHLAQGHSNESLGMVNMEAVFSTYMAPPLFAARDSMQQEFDAKADSLTDEEKQVLFENFQRDLEGLERKYLGHIEEAVSEVAKQHGLTLVVDSNVVLFGGMDLTEAVLELL